MTRQVIVVMYAALGEGCSKCGSTFDKHRVDRTATSEGWRLYYTWKNHEYDLNHRHGKVPAKRVKASQIDSWMTSPEWPANMIKACGSIFMALYEAMEGTVGRDEGLPCVKWSNYGTPSEPEK